MYRVTTPFLRKVRRKWKILLCGHYQSVCCPFTWRRFKTLKLCWTCIHSQRKIERYKRVMTENHRTVWSVLEKKSYWLYFTLNHIYNRNGYFPSLIQQTGYPFIFKGEWHGNKSEIEQEHGHSQPLVHLPPRQEDGHEHQEEHREQEEDGAAHALTWHLNGVTINYSI